MKKHLLFAGLIAGAFGIGCASKDTNSDDYSMMTKDSSMMTRDSAETVPMHVDTTTTTMTASDSSMGKVQKVMPDPAKKGKKGKVSIVMANNVSGDMSVDKEGYYNNTEILLDDPVSNSIMAATLMMGFVMEAIRKILSFRIEIFCSLLEKPKLL